MPTSTPDWQKVATALALLTVRRDVINRTLVQDADTAARAAGLEDAGELARACTLALTGTHQATTVVPRADRNGAVELRSQPVSPAAVRAAHESMRRDERLKRNRG